MSDPLYRRELLRLAADAHGAGKLAAPDATGIAFNPACGDKVTVELVIQDGRIVELAHESKACVLTQASVSILGQALCGADRNTIERLREEVAAMLESDGAPPAQPFEAYREFAGAVTYASRHRCVLLPIEAVLAAFQNSRR